MNTEHPYFLVHACDEYGVTVRYWFLCTIMVLETHCVYILVFILCFPVFMCIRRHMLFKFGDEFTHSYVSNRIMFLIQ